MSERQILVTVNGEGLIIQCGVSDELAADPAALAKFLDGVARGEILFRMEERHGAGGVVGGAYPDYTWTDDAPHVVVGENP